MAQRKRRKQLAEYSGEEQLDLLDKPDEYTKLTDKDLDHFVNFAVGVYGLTSRTEFIPKLIELYEIFRQRIAPAQRLQNYFAIREQIINGEMHVNGLLPYLFSDDDVALVSTAALDYSVLHPVEGQDSLTGPRSLLKLIANGTLANSSAAIGGLVALGDQRVMNLLTRIRHRLSNVEVEVIIKCQTGRVDSATVEFYMSWLEDLQGDQDEAIFGTVAAALCNLVRGAAEPIVRSIERVFPSTRDNAIRELGSWSIADYAKIIGPRFQAIARREKEPKVMPYVLEAWELG